MLTDYAPTKSLNPSLTDSPIQRILENLHKELSSNHDGAVADYIPELGKADPALFSICLVTADGQIYEVGEAKEEFTIQSISKPFVYGMALEDNGKSEVLSKIWMEPSGDAFNAISLRPETGQPANPMINAGAIATTSLVEGKSSKQKINRILDSMSRYCGRKLSVEETVYRSESETGHRNRAIAHMLRNFNIIDEEPSPSLEAYFMQCSISVNCHDLAVMAATLANGGVNPITGTRAVVSEYVENILSVMGSCGMYNAAGEWIYNVGMPAKSGVAGGILAVLPGQLGIGVYSPRLDERGNSVRGIEVCREISRKSALHIFNAQRTTVSVIRKRGDLSNFRSHRVRSAADYELLGDHGKAVRILQLQSDLAFASAEVAVREFSYAKGSVQEIVLDFGHVLAADFSSCGVIGMAIDSWMSDGGQVTLSRCHHLTILLRVLRKNYPEHWPNIKIFEDIDEALESCENRVLKSVGKHRSSQVPVNLDQCELLEGIEPELIQTFEKSLKPVAFKEGETVFDAGEPAGGMFFLLKGKATAWKQKRNNKERRMAVFEPGMTFGEMALLNNSPRSAEIRAQTDIETLELSLETFEALESTSPKLFSKLLRNLANILSARLREANSEMTPE
ncbi:MAG: glutaminase A [Opitutales bacterium]